MPKLLPRQYAKILYESTADLSEKDMNAVVHAFVKILKTHQMLSKAERIIAEYETYAKEQRGVERVEITSARELSPGDAESIAAHIAHETDLSVKIDPKLIGGVVIRTRNTVFDGSVRAQLEKLRQQL